MQGQHRLAFGPDWNRSWVASGLAASGLWSAGGNGGSCYASGVKLDRICEKNTGRIGAPEEAILSFEIFVSDLCLLFNTWAEKKGFCFANHLHKKYHRA
ncbi:hypothetical protein V5799_017742 [Amblyomma americanum]|uniref:Uncharacterized protein n=1 Tax=Amblyomma americanum TaxID=6943 RepID=A0AAQ4F1F0_AMBAM